ncbi:MAG TPA: hypothetical protein VLG16_03195 [Candidatus Saccharimonadales bacterium]|nr:hypothetical protein [Candidatus Saccharimonadales bacterium]
MRSPISRVDDARANYLGTSLNEVFNGADVAACEDFLNEVTRYEKKAERLMYLTSGLIHGNGVSIMQAQKRLFRRVRKKDIELPKNWHVTAFPVGMVGEVITRQDRGMLTPWPRAVFLCDDRQMRLGNLTAAKVVVDITDMTNYSEENEIVEHTIGSLVFTSELDIKTYHTTDAYGRPIERRTTSPTETLWYDFQSAPISHVLDSIIDSIS